MDDQQPSEQYNPQFHQATSVYIMSHVEGSCACGGIILRVVNGFGADTKAAICHCTDCQKAAASLFSYWAPVPVEKVQVVKGQPKAYRSPEGRSKSGKPVQRSFCSDCGTPLYALAESVPDRYCMPLALFGNDIEPGMEMFCRSAKAWEKPILPPECLYEYAPASS